VLGGADLGEWCRERTADEVVDKVWAAGVPVGRVLHGHRQPELAPLIERCFFETLDHPVAGEARYSTLPFRLPGSAGPIHRTPAPLLGQHNEDLIP